MAVAVSEQPGNGWQASLQLGFAPSGGRTAMVHRRHAGPLRVQRPFHPEGAPGHVYILHPPGGIVGGDGLYIEADVANGAHALVTTPAANKFYRSTGAWAAQRQSLRVADGGVMEWLPQEQIAFNAALADTLTQVDLAPEARFIGWELSCLGRPAAGDDFTSGALRSRFELWRAGEPLLLERNHLDGGGDILDAPWGLAGYRAMGTLVAVGAGPDDRDAVREALAQQPHRWAVTLMDDVLTVRCLGPGAEAGLALFRQAWATLRPRLLGREACAPRIWRT
jgi:urease accessory protein